MVIGQQQQKTLGQFFKQKPEVATQAAKQENPETPEIPTRQQEQEDSKEQIQDENKGQLQVKKRKSSQQPNYSSSSASKSSRKSGAKVSQQNKKQQSNIEDIQSKAQDNNEQKMNGDQSKLQVNGDQKKQVDTLDNKQTELNQLDSIEENGKVTNELLYSLLVQALEKIENTTKRLEITEIVQNLFTKVISQFPQDLIALMYLLSNRVAPEFEGKEMGIGEATIIRALSEALGRDIKYIKQELSTLGDLGFVAAKSKQGQKSFQGFGSKTGKALTVNGVFQRFKKIQTAEGKGSNDIKIGIIKELIRDSQQNEIRFLVRQLQGKMRIGLAIQTILVALGQAALQVKEGKKQTQQQYENAANIMKQVYSECPVYEQIIPALLEHKIEDLPKYAQFTPGIPVKVMLAKPMRDIQEILLKFSGKEFISELKYDGERAQIHLLENGDVKIYSRNQENNTAKYPDIVDLIPKSIKGDVKSIILDAEVVGYDRANDRILSFQELTTRKRKNVKVGDIQVQVCVYAFDCLYKNGQSLLSEPLSVRRQHLESSLSLQVGQIQIAGGIISRDVNELQQYLDDAVKQGTEGLIVKTLDATYEPSKRTTNWTKLKKDYLDAGGDSFDCILMGGKYGQGKRTGVFGSYLIGLYDPESETYQTLSKLGTGFSDEFLINSFKDLEPLIVQQPPSDYQYDKSGFIPDVWFEPKHVWEVKAADITLSPAYLSAFGVKDEKKGISIRFPRFIRIRDDKNPTDATTTDQIVEMYEAQFRTQQGRQPVSEDDMY